MSKFICFVLSVLAISLTSVCALSEAEKAAFRDAIYPIVNECSQVYGISKDDINSAKAARNANNINSCFLGCVFKKAGILNDKGVFDLDVGLIKLRKYIKNETDFAKYAEIGKKCVSVNDQTFGDREAGCEKAQLLLACFLENKAEIPL